MTLNSNYVIAPSLQEFFIDKTTGLPLAGGYVYFYSDTSPTSPKAVYELSGVAPNYSYVELPNPVILSGVGTMQDNNGNDIIPYYYPYDIDGNVELYFIKVFNSQMTPQFTRSGWPNISSQGSNTAVDFTNYIPNGQFLIHNNIPAFPYNVPTTIAGQITGPETSIGAGGWYFERPAMTSSVDIILFNRIGSYTTVPSASPRYEIQVSCTQPDPSDTYKYLSVRFPDVNKFASDSQQYTFSFTGASPGGVNVNAVLLKHFGTGGTPSADVPVSLDTFTLSNNTTIFNSTFVFGDNSNYSIGTNDDDYLELIVSFPTSSAFSAVLSDFILTAGQVVVTGFPQQTNADMLTNSVAGFMPTPDPNGFDIGLTVKVGAAGFYFDSSEIGDIIQSAVNIDPPAGSALLPCDGSQYLTSGYSSIGIPYERLWSTLFDNTLNLPLFGTGPLYSTAYASLADTTSLRITNNQLSLANNTADGSAATGFAFSNLHVGNALSFNSNIVSADIFQVICPFVPLLPVAAGTSGFSIFQYLGSGDKYVASVTTNAASTLVVAPATPSKYFLISSATINYYVWFTVDGVGQDPAVATKTGIQIYLLSTYGAQEVCQIVSEALNGYQQSLITFTAASTVNPDSWFTFYTGSNDVSYYVWYTVSGTGVDPSPSGKVGIPVDILTADTAAEVATKTQIAVNSLYYATPALQGMTLRGYDPNAVWDTGTNSRFSVLSPLYGYSLGTYEYCELSSHSHTATSVTTVNVEATLPLGPATGGSSDPLSFVTANTPPPPSAYDIVFDTKTGSTITTVANAGYGETRGTNMYVQYFIKY